MLKTVLCKLADAEMVELVLTTERLDSWRSIVRRML